MPLNKLDNFIKNTEGRILYVNPNDLDSTDAITNQGNSLAQPFKTIQRALLEAARFSYVKGDNNDLVEKTTILLFPGEHVVDNRNSGYPAVLESSPHCQTQTDCSPMRLAVAIAHCVLWPRVCCRFAPVPRCKNRDDLC